MDIKQVIRERKSIRSFYDKTVPSELVRELITYAHFAPSAGNLQARDFIIVNNNEQKEKLCQAALGQKFISEAPVNIVVCANLKRISRYGDRGKEFYCLQDCAAAVEHILLLAVDMGLGACWVGAFNDTEVASVLKLPSYVKPVAIIPIGYPRIKGTHTSRLNLNELVHNNAW